MLPGIIKPVEFKTVNSGVVVCQNVRRIYPQDFFEVAGGLFVAAKLLLYHPQDIARVHQIGIPVEDVFQHRGRFREPARASESNGRVGRRVCANSIFGVAV